MIFLKASFIVSTWILWCFTTLQGTAQAIDIQLETYINTYQSRKALSFATMQLQNTKKDHSKQMYYHTRLGLLNVEFGEYDIAALHARKAIALLRFTKDSLLWSESTMVLAQYHLMKRNADSLKMAIEIVIPYADRTKHPNLTRMYHSQMGNVFLLSNNPSEALTYFSKSLSIAQKEGLSRYIAKSLFSVAITTSMMDANKGLGYLNEVLELALKNKDTSMIATCYSGLAMNALYREDYVNWKKYNRTATTLALQGGYNRLAIYSYMQELDQFMQQKKYSEAYQKGKEIEHEIRLHKTPIFELYLDSMMYKTCKELKKVEEGMEYLEKYAKKKSVQFKTQQRQLTDELTLKYQLKEKDLQLYNQNLKLAISQNRNILLLISNVLLIVIISAYFLYRKQKANHNRQLYRKEKMMDLRVEQERKILSSNEFTVQQLSEDSANKYQNDEGINELGKEQSQYLFKQMILAIEDKKLYLNPELSQKNLVTILGTNRNYLSKAISENSTYNFKQIINQYRVEEVKNRIKDMINIQSIVSLEQIYNDAGFNSESSYYRAFRYFTGLTPKEYMQEYLRDIRQ